MDAPFFTIITPNYNSGNKLLRAVRSLSGNNVSFEHIVIDDCSSDKSFQLPAEFESSTKIFRNKKNLGPGPSRNKGLQIAKGRYIIFLDSDDFFVPGALDCIQRIILSKKYPDVLVFGYHLARSRRLNSFNVDADLGGVDLAFHDKHSLLVKYLLDEVVSSPWGKCISSSLAKKVKFPPLRVSQDAFFNLDIFLLAEVAVITGQKLYVFDKSDSNSLTSKPFDYQEFKKFYKSWIAFEKKFLSDSSLDAYESLLYARKIKFCVLYYLNRLALTPEEKIDSRVVGFVKLLFLKNFWRARKNLSGKAVGASFLFCICPRFTLRLIKSNLLRRGQ